MCFRRAVDLGNGGEDRVPRKGFLEEEMPEESLKR